jgi:hypothetical protein
MEYFIFALIIATVGVGISLYIIGKDNKRGHGLNF